MLENDVNCQKILDQNSGTFLKTNHSQRVFIQGRGKFNKGGLQLKIIDKIEYSQITATQSHA